MKMTYGTLAVEGTSWTNPDNVAIQVANTVRFFRRLKTHFYPMGQLSNFDIFTINFRQILFKKFKNQIFLR